VLDITAADCAATLPESARRRSYAATIAQTGAVLYVRLSGGDFIVVKGRGDKFGGLLGGDDNVTFTIGAADYSFYYYFYYGGLFDLAERFTATTALIVNGRVQARASAAGITGTLSGSIGFSPKITPPFWPRMDTCSSTGHRFEMRR
jgi:hypothetical protein